jgi:acyl-CoA thioesterase FadM
MRWIRLLQSLLFSRFRNKLAITGTSTIKFTVWLTDIDASIMNHAAMMTVFEAGRIDLMVRTGFFKIARKKNWFFPSTSISVQFFRPLKAFQQALLMTRVFHVDDQFIYTEQKISRREKDIAICIVKSKVKSGKENVSTGEIIKLLNAGYMPTESKELIELFEKQDAAFKNKICI